MGVIIKNLQFHITCFLVTTMVKSSQGCTPFTARNLGSIDGTLLKSTLEAAKNLIPVINTSTMPDLDSLTEKFNAASSNEDIHYNITQLLNKYGYPTEIHQVNSKGYQIKIFRIPGKGKTVLVEHGLLSSANDFVSSGPDRGLAYNLADQGYDVWLGNARGTVHGRKHDTLSPDCAEFWDFSWDEIGRYDLPATIDYILEKTGQEKLAFVAHAQGCTSFFVMASELPEYNDKISVMVALSAISFNKNSRCPLFNILAPISGPFYSTAKAIGLYEFGPRNAITDLITSTACGTAATATLFCNNLLFIVFGFDYAQVNATILPVVFDNFPGGSATKQTVHYLQEIISGKFRQFDYGTDENLKRYNSTSPPDYALEKITSKVAIIHSDNDYFTVDVDREKLESLLPNVIESYRVPLASFSHADFLFANDLKTLVNDKVLEILKDNA